MARFNTWYDDGPTNDPDWGQERLDAFLRLRNEGVITQEELDKIRDVLDL